MFPSKVASQNLRRTLALSISESAENDVDSLISEWTPLVRYTMASLEPAASSKYSHFGRNKTFARSFLFANSVSLMHLFPKWGSTPGTSLWHICSPPVSLMSSFLPLQIYVDRTGFLNSDRERCLPSRCPVSLYKVQDARMGNEKADTEHD